jgi:hypothetical protein
MENEHHGMIMLMKRLDSIETQVRDLNDKFDKILRVDNYCVDIMSSRKRFNMEEEEEEEEIGGIRCPCF